MNLRHFWWFAKKKCSNSPTKTSVLGAIRFQEVAICWCMWEFWSNRQKSCSAHEGLTRSIELLYRIVLRTKEWRSYFQPSLPTSNVLFKPDLILDNVIQLAIPCSSVQRVIAFKLIVRTTLHNLHNLYHAEFNSFIQSCVIYHVDSIQHFFFSFYRKCVLFQ